MQFFSVQNVDDWSFDVFALNEVGDGHALRYVGYELLHRYDVINKFKVTILLRSPVNNFVDGFCSVEYGLIF